MSKKPAKKPAPNRKAPAKKAAPKRKAAAKKANGKGPGGRPSRYNPKLHIPMINQVMGVDGKSFIYFCAIADICKTTGENWKKEHPEFLDAFARASVKAEAIWQDKTEAMIVTPGVNAGLHKLLMANRFGWTDKIETDNKHSGDVGLSINIDLGRDDEKEPGL